MKLQTFRLSPGNFAILPPDEIQQNIVQRKRFGFWPQTKIKEVRVKYHIFNGRIIATFHRVNKNVTFFNYQAAERWLERPFDISPVVGNRILLSDATIQMTASCTCGRIKTRRKSGYFYVPEQVFDHKLAIPELEIHGMVCPRCHKNCHLDIHQIGNIHVRLP